MSAVIVWSVLAKGLAVLGLVMLAFWVGWLMHGLFACSWTRDAGLEEAARGRGGGRAPREHRVLCARCLARFTWAWSGVCELCSGVPDRDGPVPASRSSSARTGRAPRCSHTEQGDE